MNNALQFAGLTAEQMFQKVVQQGVPAPDAAVLLGTWIYENYGRAQRTFTYGQTLAPAEAACAPNFVRSFAHVDWIDGQHVVQAESTAGEVGFNARFHRIEADLDSLGANVAKVFACLAELRQSVAARLEELRVELNRVLGDIHRCCNDDKLPTLTAVPHTNLMASAQFKGIAQMNGKDVTIWDTNGGPLILPSVMTVGAELLKNPRVTTAGVLAELFVEEPAIRQTFSGPVRVQELVDRFGNVRGADPRPVRELLAIVPSNTRFQTLDHLVEDVAAREAAALRTTTGTADAVTALFGLQSGVSPVREASIDDFRAIPAEVRTALRGMGVQKVGQLFDHPPGQLRERLQGLGVRVPEGQIANWQATARTLNSIRG